MHRLFNCPCQNHGSLGSSVCPAAAPEGHHQASWFLRPFLQFFNAVSRNWGGGAPGGCAGEQRAGPGGARVGYTWKIKQKKKIIQKKPFSQAEPGNISYFSGSEQPKTKQARKGGVRRQEIANVSTPTYARLYEFPKLNPADPDFFPRVFSFSNLVEKDSSAAKTTCANFQLGRNFWMPGEDGS